jgi:hypothetical protein
MPKDKDDDTPAPAAKKSKPTVGELYDELELLKANGNKDPDRVAELKRLIAEG